MLLTNVTRLKLSSTYPKSHLPLPQSHLPIRLYGILTPNTQPHPRSCIPYPRSYITYPRSNIPHPKSHLPISLNRTPTPGYTYPIQGYTSFTCLTNYCRLHVWVFGLDYSTQLKGEGGWRQWRNQCLCPVGYDLSIIECFLPWLAGTRSNTAGQNTPCKSTSLSFCFISYTLQYLYSIAFHFWVDCPCCSSRCLCTVYERCTWPEFRTVNAAVMFIG